MYRLRLAIVGIAIIAALALPAAASAYTFTMTLKGSPGTGVTMTAVCEGDYQTGGTGLWSNTKMRSHWYYNKWAGIDTSLGAHYQIGLYQGSTLKWSTDTYGVLCDNYYEPGKTPPAHWRTWPVMIKTKRGSTHAWWFIEGPYNDTHEHTTATY